MFQFREANEFSWTFGRAHSHTQTHTYEKRNQMKIFMQISNGWNREQYEKYENVIKQNGRHFGPVQDPPFFHHVAYRK